MHHAPNAPPPTVLSTFTLHTHTILRLAQDEERTFLRTAFHLAQGLEARRIEVVKQAVGLVAEEYLGALMPIQQDLVGLSPATQQVKQSVGLKPFPRLSRRSECVGVDWTLCVTAA